MRKWYPVACVVLATVVSAIAYPRLPAEVPTHWTAHGVVNGYSSKAVGAFIAPVIMLGIWALMRAVPSIDPRAANYAKMRGAYDLILDAVVTMLLLTHAAMIAAMLGVPVSMSRVMPVLVGTLLVVVGNVLPQARPNWLFGIRTPWTLTNDRVWQETHRIGGYLFVACGLVMILSALLPPVFSTPVLVGSVVIASLGSIVFSFIAWKQETSR